MAKYRIGIVGVPGSGKTTLSRALSGAIRKGVPDIKTIELVSEYARVYIHNYGFRDIVDQLLILDKQLKWEDAYPESTDLVITDSPVFLGVPYSLDMAGTGDKRDHKILSEILSRMVELNAYPRYDIIFHLPPKVEPVRDGVRSEQQFDPAWRFEMDQNIQSTFRVFRPRHLITLHETDVDARVSEAIDYINRVLFDKIESVAEIQDTISENYLDKLPDVEWRKKPVSEIVHTGPIRLPVVKTDDPVTNWANYIKESLKE